jgi:hypothetical protein
MRQLTATQKKLIKMIIDRNEPNDSEAQYGKANPIRTADDLSPDEWEALEKINDTEILWQEVNRFIYDYNFSKL